MSYFTIKTLRSQFISLYIVSEFGPKLLYMHLFSGICVVEGKPNRRSQDICLRRLWTNTQDRYAFGVTFHEAETVKHHNFFFNNLFSYLILL